VVDATSPRRLTAEPVATIPLELQRHEPSQWAAEVLGVPSVGSFLEGPCFGPDGVLHVSDLAHGRVFRISPAGDVLGAVDVGRHPNGLARHADGRVFVADYGAGVLALEGDVAEALLTTHRLEPFRGLSDLVFAADGTLYFTDQGQSDLRYPTGRLFRWSAAAGTTVLMDGIASPNGVALSPDGRVLYVAVTRAGCVYRVPLRPDGSLGKVGVFVHAAGGAGGPDGLAVAADGSLAVAQYGVGQVSVFDCLGRLTAVITTPTGLGTTNVAYGLDDPTALYITEADSGSVLRARLDVPGLPLFGGTGAATKAG
jgi:gluconolactonase